MVRTVSEIVRFLTLHLGRHLLLGVSATKSHVVGTRSSIAQRIAARESLDAYGTYAVPHLVGIVQRADAEGDLALRDRAVFFLQRAARRPLVDPYASAPTAEQRAQNRAIGAENVVTRALRYLPEASEEEKRRVLAGWQAWYDEHRGRWQYDFGEKLHILLFETRFAAYWRNLIRLDFGVSLVTKQPVLTTLVSKLPYSLTLSVGSLLAFISLLRTHSSPEPSFANDMTAERCRALTM